MTISETGRVLGIEVGSTVPVFLIVLAVHVPAGVVAVAAGAVAALSPKRRGRHPRAGRIYYLSLSVMTAALGVLSALRWPHDVPLLAIGLLGYAAATVGFVARRRRQPGWLRAHAIGMALSYSCLLTGFYVDNGPNLPLWDRLPHLTYWLLPSVIGVPLLVRALRHHTRSVTGATARLPPGAGRRRLPDGR